MVEVIVRGVKGATVVDLHGRLDFNARWHFKAIMNQCCLNESEHLIINLTELTFIDSAGLGFLVTAYLQFTGLKRRMTWIQPKGVVATMLDELKLQELVPICASERDVIL
ncbi:MAG: STAS domain-containing protein [Nitrospirales bacterium]